MGGCNISKTPRCRATALPLARHTAQEASLSTSTTTRAHDDTHWGIIVGTAQTPIMQSFWDSKCSDLTLMRGVSKSEMAHHFDAPKQLSQRALRKQR